MSGIIDWLKGNVNKSNVPKAINVVAAGAVGYMVGGFPVAGLASGGWLLVNAGDKVDSIGIQTLQGGMVVGVARAALDMIVVPILDFEDKYCGPTPGAIACLVSRGVIYGGGIGLALGGGLLVIVGGSYAMHHIHKQWKSGASSPV